LKIFYSDNFKGLNPVGTCAIVKADNAAEAKEMLKAELSRLSIDQDEDDFTMTEVKGGKQVIVVNDGDY
jgi:hypothetical protein